MNDEHVIIAQLVRRSAQAHSKWTVIQMALHNLCVLEIFLIYGERGGNPPALPYPRHFLVPLTFFRNIALSFGLSRLKAGLQ